MSHITTGERAYLPEDDSFGDVLKKKFLGIEGIVLVNDDGAGQAFCGPKMKERIVNTSTGKNGNDEAVEIPTDVKVEGVSVLGSLNITPEQQRLMFIKFKGMFSKEERRAHMTEWRTVKNDPVEKSIFLNNMIQLLDDDEVFISVQGKKALIEVEPEVQRKMFTKFLTTVSKTERVQYIVKWMTVKNNRKEKEEFLQEMYELLMEDEDFLRHQGRKDFTNMGLTYNDQMYIFQKLLRTVDSTSRRNYIIEYRRIRRSRSQRTKFLNNLINEILNIEEEGEEPVPETLATRIRTN